jgi:hypothetical protein
MSKRHELDPAALASAVTSGAVERYEKLGRIGEGTYGVVRDAAAALAHAARSLAP